MKIFNIKFKKLFKNYYYLIKKSSTSLILFLFLTTVILGGIGIFLTEESFNDNISNFWDSIWYTIVTVSTVGYGDISPRTGAGQALAALVMILGYSIIAVPTGIVTVEIASAAQRKYKHWRCGECGAPGHDTDARYCKYCGALLSD